MLFFLLIQSCSDFDLNVSLDDGNLPVFDGPITGYVKDGTTSLPIINAIVTLQKNTNPGFLNLPAYTTLAQVKTDTRGYFKIDFDNTQHLQITVKYDSTYLIEEKEYRMYDGTAQSLGPGEVKDLQIYLTPTAVLDITFKTNTPLTGDDKLSIFTGYEGTNYSSTYRVPSERRFVCKGNSKNKISWTVQRDSSKSESYNAEIYIPAFSKKDYTINY